MPLANIKKRRSPCSSFAEDRCAFTMGPVCKPSAFQLWHRGRVDIPANLKLLTQRVAPPNELCTQQTATLSEYCGSRKKKNPLPQSYYTRWPAGHPVQYPTLAHPIRAIFHVQSLDHIMWRVWFKGVKMRLLNSSSLIQSVWLLYLNLKSSLCTWTA